MTAVIVLGIVLIIVGWITGLGLLIGLGFLLAIVGAVFLLAANVGGGASGRRHYW